MFFQAVLPVLLISAFAAAAPAPASPGNSRVHTPKPINIDTVIFNRLEKLFEDSAAPSNSTIVARASSDTRDDINNGYCDDVVIIFARGTSGSGNIGTGVGVAFVDAVSSREPGRVIVQGVKPYSATIAGYLAGGSDEGAASMAALTVKAANQCPGASIIWGGYSQGAQVTHKAGALLSSSYYSRIKAIVLFGDPYDGDAFPGTLNSHVKTYCNDDDPICDGLPFPIAGHLTYDTDGSTTSAGVYVAGIV